MRGSGRIVLLTGAPGVGKTTVMRQVVAGLGAQAGGFYTREVRQGEQRVGFALVTLAGERRWLAYQAPQPYAESDVRFGRYWVRVEAIEQTAVPALQQALAQGLIVIVDEIGPMELLSGAFCASIKALLETPGVTVAGTIVQRSHPFADWVKRHPRVTVWPVSVENREEVPPILLETLLPSTPTAS